MPLSRMAVEVFCSYAHEDEEYRQQLEIQVSTLKRQGLISLWHDRQILPGANWADTVDKHLETASIIVLLMSADFIASDYCYAVEMKRALERHKVGEARVVPVVVRPCDWQQLPVGELQALPTDAKPISMHVSVDEAWTQVVTGLRGIIEDLSRLPVSPPQTDLPQVWMIPYSRNPFFLGRHELLDRLRTLLQTAQSAAIGQPQAISGLGGIGKTQIAVEYAYRFHQDYQAVLWVRADSVEALNSSYTTCAALLNLPQKDSREQVMVVQAVKSWLRTHRGWLLILDSADEPDLLPPFLPPVASGHILLTTRATDLGGLGLGIAHPMEVETFSLEQGALFLLRRANLLTLNATLDQSKPQDEELAKQITHELGGLPLALDQAGAYLAATDSPLTMYLQIYQQYRIQLLSERRNRDYPESVATTWNISFERVKVRNPAAAELLRFCAFLAPDAIPEEIFIEGASKLDPVLASVASNANLFNQAIEALRAYSLIARNPQTHTLSVHRLVQVVLRDTLPMQTQKTGWRHFLQTLRPDTSHPRTQQQWMQHVVRVVHTTFPSVEPGNWSQCERLLPHALVCAFWIEQVTISPSTAASLLSLVGTYLEERARYSEAEPLLQRALSINEQRWGQKRPRTAMGLNNLAHLYVNQGKYEQAEPLYRRALDICVRRLGPEHPQTAVVLDNLASLYVNQGKYAQTESLYQHALATCMQRLGSEHPRTAASFNNLARLYITQGKYTEAQQVCLRALAICERRLGPEHPYTATTLCNLAHLYAVRGEYTQAEPLYRRALAIERQMLGSEHPTIAAILTHLADLYARQKKYVQAELLYQHALSIQEYWLGPEHPMIAGPLNNLADLYCTQGRYSEAELLYRRALDIGIQQLGPQHLSTAQSFRGLALLYRSQGRYVRGSSLFLDTLAILEQAGYSHTQEIRENYSALQQTIEQLQPMIEQGTRNKLVSQSATRLRRGRRNEKIFHRSSRKMKDQEH